MTWFARSPVYALLVGASALLRVLRVLRGGVQLQGPGWG